MKQKIKRGIRVSRYVIYRETLVDYREQFWSALGALIGIGLIALLQSYVLHGQEQVLLIGSFGASSVLVYGAIQSPLAQPRNLVGGHVISAVIGVSIGKFLPDIVWVQAPLAVALSIVAMQVTKTLHPPGGATALIAVTGSQQIIRLGYWFVLFPVLTGAVLLLLVALIFNNMTSHRQYPTTRRYTRWFRKQLRLSPAGADEEEPEGEDGDTEETEGA